MIYREIGALTGLETGRKLAHSQITGKMYWLDSQRHLWTVDGTGSMERASDPPDDIRDLDHTELW